MLQIVSEITSLERTSSFQNSAIMLYFCISYAKQIAATSETKDVSICPEADGKISS